MEPTLSVQKTVGKAVGQRPAAGTAERKQAGPSPAARPAPAHGQRLPGCSEVAGWPAGRLAPGRGPRAARQPWRCPWCPRARPDQALRAPRASPLVVRGEDATARRVVAVFRLPGAGGAALVLAVCGSGRHGEAGGPRASPGWRRRLRGRAPAGAEEGGRGWGYEGDARSADAVNGGAVCARAHQSGPRTQALKGTGTGERRGRRGQPRRPRPDPTEIPSPRRTAPAL